MSRNYSEQDEHKIKPHLLRNSPRTPLSPFTAHEAIVACYYPGRIGRHYLSLVQLTASGREIVEALMQCAPRRHDDLVRPDRIAIAVENGDLDMSVDIVCVQEAGRLGPVAP